ncbi:adenosine deaminase [Corynebacterium lizhenjunii]|uniref:Adenosine deaminase n=1 Tax=Corynebacterium lizhenjunii TaxID=2709394 RepID=A0A7T0KEA5_9CORY|nr:adenosine deaminase [Corynebacterium lizhenjunii]QPK78731.1 adenosine deaminase [Corynebacterium lizhenjunii]
MHDAPMISPENKDSDAFAFARLPKVSLYVPLPTAATPAELADATVALLADLRADTVVYAELHLEPGAYAFPAAQAVEAVLGVLDAEADVDARVVLCGSAEVVDCADSPRVVGALVPGDQVAQVRRAWLPAGVDAAESLSVVEAAAQTGVQRLLRATCVTDDLRADLDGIVPGPVAGWVRDRAITLVVSPLADQAAGVVDALADHPLPLLQQLGFTCAVAAADLGPGALTREFVALNETFGYGLEEFFDLTVTAMESAFAPEPVRREVLRSTILPAYEALGETVFAEEEA